MHVIGEVAAACDEYVAFGQRSHAVSPGAALKLPDAQTLHVPWSRVYPALHSHETLLAADPSLSVHTEHTDEPEGEKVLGGQETHDMSGDMVDPAGHVEHSEIEVALVTGMCLPAAQATQIRLIGACRARGASFRQPRIACRA